MQRTPPELRSAARSLRTNATEAERKVWYALRGHRPRWTRQLVVSHYILDFACRSVRLGVELDGGHHALQQGADAARTQYLQGQGWSVLRFWNNDVLANTDGVVQVILNETEARASTHPQPLPSREGSR